ncbi:MAG TPA: hypothetical protein VG795_07745, partial [Acidimicrobiia bacterium]|nr:hypothetical protein [Acidimicrobiia bacterium]
MLYVTYSRSLAQQAEEYFRAFGPVGTSVDVVTFEEFLLELADTPDPIDFLRAEEGAVELGAHLRSFRQPLAPWDDRWDELYAELHAYVVGRALPIPFRSLPAAAGLTLTADAYRAIRNGTVPDAGIDRLFAVSRFLADKGALPGLLPGPTHAARLIRPPDVPPPPRFRDVAWVFVDEVQDLTQVELLLLLSVTARIGRHSGAMPGMVIAGDEAQTVRPTDFQWGWLGDLIETTLGSRLGRRQDFQLTSNVRSPVAIGSVVEKSWERYRLFDKERRPSGYVYTSSDESVPGRVLYSWAANDQEWADLVAFFDTHPGAQLVYPGYRLPPDLAGGEVDILTSEQAKGLDYQIVGVVDAGRRQQELAELSDKAESEPLHGLWGRTLADQFRVALSRPTETLLFLDRDENFAGWVRDLCGTEMDDVLEEVDVADAILLLGQDTTDVDEVLTGLLHEIRRIIDEQPDRALRRARTAAGVLNRSETEGEISSDLVAECHRLRGVAAALVVRRHRQRRSPDEVALLEREAASNMAAAGLKDLYAHILVAQRATTAVPTSPTILPAVTAAAGQYGAVVAKLPELEADFRTGM